MFAKDKVSQSMIDAVKQVVETAPIKEPTPTGMRVYGGSYGNSAKAKQDQTKKDIDNLKGPKAKEMKEAAKPDFLDMDKDGNKKESMKKAIADKNMKEELKSETFEFHLIEGSYADLHKKWGDTHNIEYHSHTLYPKHTVTKFDNEKDAESHAKKTGGTVRMSVSPKMKNEELKGNQDRIDANHNNKIDAQDFKILRAKKKVSEGMHFAGKLLEAVRKSDVPAYLRKAKGDTPLTMADVKGPKKDSISAPENLAKARNEEVEQIDEVSLKTATSAYVKRMGDDGPNEKSSQDKAIKTMDLIAKKHGVRGVARAAKTVDDKYGINDPVHNPRKAFVKQIMSGVKEEIESLDEDQLDEMINEVLGKDASAGDYIHDFIHSDNPKFAGKSKAERKKMALGAYYGKQNEEVVEENYKQQDDAPITTDTLAGRLPGGKINSFKSYKLRVKPLDKEGDGSAQEPACDQPEKTSARASVHAEATIAGTPGWEPMKKDAKDKSGAVHTPMSRARDLAKSALKRVQDKTKIK
jgi:hypothetical protein